MNELVEHFGEAGRMETPLRDASGQGQWSEALVAMGPFLLFALPTALYMHDTVPSQIGFGCFVAAYIVLLAGLAVGWAKGFPGWSYPYAGLVLAITLMLVSQRDSEEPLIFNLLMSFCFATPFLVVVAVALVKLRTSWSLSQLSRDVRHDWTRLSFAVYGLLPAGVIIAFAAIEASYGLPYLLVSTIALAAGALIYMLSARTWPRALTLLMGLTLAWASATAATATYWHERQASWMTAPGNEVAIARGSAIGWAVLVALILAPALLGLVRRSVESTWAA
jgi:hypothetical protein